MRRRAKPDLDGINPKSKILQFRREGSRDARNKWLQSAGWHDDDNDTEESKQRGDSSTHTDDIEENDAVQENVNTNDEPEVLEEAPVRTIRNPADPTP